MYKKIFQEKFGDLDIVFEYLGMKTEKTRTVMAKLPNNFGTLGKEIKVSPKAYISHNQAGLKIEFFTPTVDVLIGIGKDHVAYLMMDEDAWKALNKGEDINIETLKGFKQKFIDPKKVVRKRRTTKK